MFTMTPKIYKPLLEKFYSKTLEGIDRYIQILTKVNSNKTLQFWFDFRCFYMNQVTILLESSH